MQRPQGDDECDLPKNIATSTGVGSSPPVDPTKDKEKSAFAKADAPLKPPEPPSQDSMQGKENEETSNVIKVLPPEKPVTVEPEKPSTVAAVTEVAEPIKTEPLDAALPKSTQPEEPASDPLPEPKGSCGRCRRRYEQQEPSTNDVPLWCFDWMMQTGCACCCAFILFLIGIILVTGSSSVLEVSVDYKYPDASATFEVPERMDGDVLIWYEVPDVLLNQKGYVESKDSKVFKPFIIGATQCESSETQADAGWRRIKREKDLRAAQGDDTTDLWGELVQAVPGEVFAPCGLQSIAMFSDEYQLQDADGKSISLDESDISLETDEAIYEATIEDSGDGSSQPFTIDGKPSWLKAGSFYEHFKVWMRSPCAPRARHLWARIRGGLDAGKYTVTFTQSAIWTSMENWRVDTKRVIFSTSKTFGSKGAYTFLGVISLILACLEAMVAAFFVVSYFVKKGKANEA